MPDGLRLLPADALIRTGPVDHADWNYRPLLGTVSRARFRLALSLLPARVDAILELGYGSGVFVPSLAARARHVAGFDVHDRAGAVAAVLRARGIEADLRTGDGRALPFADGAFDAVVAVSALEFVEDLDGVCAQVVRVLRPGGTFVVVTPGESPLLDRALRLATGKDARTDFGDRRSRVEPALRRAFRVRRERAFPFVLGRIIPVYRAFQCDPAHKGAGAG
ncbi:MAG TPA: class I SAM-dependent methyltransferase [Candidatus Elarobacter sp.]|nr:class I SAM-dependent methyltransferase [Candidatus Elarobacter sp.]